MSHNALLSITDYVRAIGSEGLSFASDPYDVARYEKLIELTAQSYADLGNLPVEDIRTAIKERLEIITPKLGVDVAITNEAGDILALRRSDNDKWCLPGGWADIGEGPEETATREAREETGLNVKAIGCIGLMYKGPHTAPEVPHQLALLFWTELLSSPDDIKLSHEHTDFRWLESAEGFEWAPGHKMQFENIVKFRDSNRSLTLPVDIPTQ